MTLKIFCDKILTKSYHDDILNVQLEIMKVIYIGNQLTATQKHQVEMFLKRVCGLLATNQITFSPNNKNKIFDRTYSMSDERKRDILRSLTADDCISIEMNDNPRYEDAEVYKFIKSIDACFYGEQERIDLYIKMYIHDCDFCEEVLVISFHKEGMFE